MKNLITAFLVSLLLISCGEDADMPPMENPSVVTSISGILKCLNDIPIESVDITLTDESGDVYTSSTDATGAYSFDDLANGTYTFTFVDPTLYDFSTAEYNTLYADLENVVLAARAKTNIDHIAYNLINYEDGLTTLDMVMIDRLNDGEMLLSEVDIPWRYVFTSELLTNDAVTNQLSISYSGPIVMDITAIHVGDNTGLVCN